MDQLTPLPRSMNQILILRKNPTSIRSKYCLTSLPTHLSMKLNLLIKQTVALFLNPKSSALLKSLWTILVQTFSPTVSWREQQAEKLPKVDMTMPKLLPIRQTQTSVKRFQKEFLNEKSVNKAPLLHIALNWYLTSRETTNH